MSYLQKLIEISSHSLSLESKQNIPDKLWDLYKQKDGFIAFESALRIYEKSYCDYINDVVGNITPYNIYIFGDNALGDLFCLFEDGFFKYDLELDEFEELGKTIEEFSERLLLEYNYYTGYSLCKDWMMVNGNLSIDKILMPKIPFSLGGEYSIGNLIAYPKIEGMKVKAMFSNKIRFMNEGDKIELSSCYLL